MPTAAELRAMITQIKPKEEPKEKLEEVKKIRKSKLRNTSGENLQESSISSSPSSSDAVKTKRASRKDYAGNGHWSFDQAMAAKDKFGFIYVIRDLKNGKCYIGKKQYRGRGDENFGIESNWPWYCSSRDTLVEQIKLWGKDYFEFIVLEEYSSNKALGYAEVWSLMHAETPSNQDKWYNRLVNKINWFCKESITQRHKDRLDAIIRGETLTTIVTE